MSAYKNVLIVSYHFPPLNIMASKRFGTMCKYMEEFGYRPHIITARIRRGSYLTSKLDLDVPVPDLDIIRIGASGIIYPIPNLLEMLLCEYFDTHKLYSRVLDVHSVGWFEKVKKEIDLGRFRDIDVVLGTFPPVSNLLIAGYLARCLHKPLIADIRDLISDYEESIPSFQRTKGFDRICEPLLLECVSGITTVTEGFSEILKKRYPGKKVKTVYNGWDYNSAEKSAARSGDKFLYYAGSLYEHRLESLDVLLRAMTELEEITLKIRSIGPADLDRKVEKMIADMQLEQKVELLGPENEDVIRREQAEAHINVVLSSIHTEDEALMTTIPGKLLELLPVNAPVLAITPKHSEIDRVLTETQKGIASIREEEIKNFILSVDGSCPGNRAVEFYSRKRQTENLCSFMDEILGVT